MPRPKKWEDGKFSEINLKLPVEKKEKYQNILEIKGRNMQQDFEQHVDKTINE